MGDKRYDGEPLTIDEADPSTWRIKGPPRPVFFENLAKMAPDWDDMRNALKSSRMKSKVRRLVVGRSSMMKQLQLLPAFPNADTVEVLARGSQDVSLLGELPQLCALELAARRSKSCSLAVLPKLPLRTLWVCAMDAADIENVNGCEELELLGLYDYPFEDLSALSGTGPDYIHLAGGKVARARGSASPKKDTTKFTKCRKLTDLADLATDYLELEFCHAVNLDSLAEVHELRVLWINGRKTIDDWSFLDRCSALEHLAVSGTRVAAEDWTPIVNSARLELAWLGYPVPNRRILEIGEANRDLVVTNGNVCMARGEQADLDAYYDYEKQVQSRRKRARSKK
jgi:hypothetical protein